METDRSPSTQAVEATAVWFSMAVFFLFWPVPGTVSDLAVEVLAALGLIAVVAVVSTFILEGRLPQLLVRAAPLETREFLVIAGIGGIVFAALLAAVLETGSWPRWGWVAYLGLGYSITMARILLRRY